MAKGVFLTEGKYQTHVCCGAETKYLVTDKNIDPYSVLHHKTFSRIILLCKASNANVYIRPRSASVIVKTHRINVTKKRLTIVECPSGILSLPEVVI